LAAQPRLRFFPKYTAAPSLNGAATNGGPQKSVIVDPRIFSGSVNFWPTNGNGGTTLDYGVGGARSWYRAAWLAYACMRYRATKLIEAPLWIREERDGTETWLEGDHPLAELLERPNPDMEMVDLLEVTSLFLDTTGACLWVKAYDRGGRVAALYPYSKDQFTSRAKDGRIYGEFELTTTASEKIKGPDDVILFRNVDPDDPHDAVAPLDAALSRLGIDRTLLQSIRGGLLNSVVPGMTLSFPATEILTPEQREEIKADLAAGYEGARNHGKALVVGGGATASRNKLGFAGLEGGELSKENEAAVCACFQLPPVVIGAYVGLANSSDRHNLETSVLLVYDNAIIPTWARMEKALTRGLLRPVDKNPLRFIRFDHGAVKALQADLGHQAEIIGKAGRALTVNDARAMLGLQPLEDERGDRLLEDGAVVESGGVDSATGEKRKPASAKARTVDPDQMRWAIHDAVLTGQEPGWELAAHALLEEDRRACLALADATLRAEPVKDDAPFRPADAGSVRELIRRVAERLDGDAATAWRKGTQGLIEAVGRRSVERVAAELAISFDVLQPGLDAFVEREAAFLVQSVTGTTKEAIRTALAAGLAEGEAIPALRKRIEEAGAFSRSRAELIARTEVTRVANGAQRESLSAYAKEIGGRVTKRWLSARDGRVRDAHRPPLDGEVRGIDEAFSNGLQEPSEPNCLVAGTVVEGAYVGGLRADYAGEVVVIQTAGGRYLTVTPNHPILTPRGFVAAKDLREGDDLVGYRPSVAGECPPGTDEHHGPAAIEEVFRALAERYPRLSRDTAVENLHGDAASVQGEIEVVGPGGILLHDTRSPLPEVPRDQILVLAAMEEAEADSAGASDLLGWDLDAPSRGCPSSGALTIHDAAVRRLELPPLQTLRFGAASELHPRFFEAEGERRTSLPGSLAERLEGFATRISRYQRGDTDSLPPHEDAGFSAQADTALTQNAVEDRGADAQLADDLCGRFPTLIAPDQIVRVGRDFYTGHVYDLQSVSGWNIAAGVVVSNCRCTLVYELETQ
jgi:HK97 family phage portal protein